MKKTRPCTRCKIQNVKLYQQGLCKHCLQKDFDRLRPLLSVKSSSTKTIQQLPQKDTLLASPLLQRGNGGL